MAESEAIEKVREEKREHRELMEVTREQRKKLAMEVGTKVHYITCPLCGRNQPVKQWGREIKPFNVKPDYDIVQIRKGGGKANPRDVEKILDMPATETTEVPGIGLGWFRVGGYKLEELKEKRPDLWKNLKTEVRKLSELIESI